MLTNLLPRNLLEFLSIVCTYMDIRLRQFSLVLQDVSNRYTREAIDPKILR